MTERIYAVRITANGSSQTRLVAASSQAQARNHVAEQLLAVSIPTPAELIALTKRGVEVEKANGE